MVLITAFNYLIGRMPQDSGDRLKSEFTFVKSQVETIMGFQ